MLIKVINCTVVMGKCEYDEQMRPLLSDKNTYEKVIDKNCIKKIRD